MLDPAEVQAFVERIRGMASDAAVLAVIAAGAETGLFTAMSAGGPATADEIAQRARLHPAHVRDALRALTAARLVSHDPASERFELTGAAAVCLSDPGSPLFVGAMARVVMGLLETLPAAVASFRTGAGIENARFSAAFVAGFDQLSRAQYGTLLVSQWLQALPDVLAALRRGGAVADLGCGGGAGALAIARAFPKTHILGVDIDARAIARARDTIELEGLANVDFAVGDATALVPGRYDLVLAFGVLHNLADPLDALRRIAAALRTGGTLLIQQPALADDLTQNLDPAAAMVYALSTLYSVPLALANGGAGLGASWGPDATASLCREAGLARFRRLPIPHPVNAFYEAHRA